jgi:nucleotide-binding universal stress UspA family protein
VSPQGEAPILVAVDFSPDSDAAFAWAADLAGRLAAPLHVLHVVHEPAASPGYYERTGGSDWVQLESVARKMLERYVQQMREKLPGLGALPGLDASVVSGLPETRILEIAERVGARMIVLGGQGRTALADILLGSKAERVVRLSSVPVTVVRASDAARTRGKK